MKNTFLILSILVLVLPVFGQEEASSEAGGALIADIMNINPVTVTMSEENEKAKGEYEKLYESEKSKLDKALAKESEDYKKDVQDLIQKFSKVLDKAIEQDVANEKKAVASKVNALTYTLRKDKKALLTTFNNKLVKELRDLPNSIGDEKEDELDDYNDEHKENFEKEFEANQGVIKQFKATEYLIQEEAGGAAPSDG